MYKRPTHTLTFVIGQTTANKPYRKARQKISENKPKKRNEATEIIVYYLDITFSVSSPQKWFFGTKMCDMNQPAAIDRRLVQLRLEMFRRLYSMSPTNVCALFRIFSINCCTSITPRLQRFSFFKMTFSLLVLYIIFTGHFWSCI